MTKAIRIENADTSTYKVRVYFEDLVQGEWVRQPVPYEIDFPTALTTQYIHSTRRLVIEEAP